VLGKTYQRTKKAPGGAFKTNVYSRVLTNSGPGPFGPRHNSPFDKLRTGGLTPSNPRHI